MKRAVLSIVSQHFRPEFINRVDDVVVFHPLARDQLRAIAQIQLQSLRDRLLERDMQLSITEAALLLLTEQGFDPVYGARPLKRAIQRGLENPLAQRLLDGTYVPGDTVQVDASHGEFVFGAHSAAGPTVAAAS